MSIGKRKPSLLFSPARGEKRKKYPLTLPSPAKWRGKMKRKKNLTALLTFILSRKGKEEMEGKILKDPLTLALSRRWRGEKEDEKI
jgi:hypothetical protein